MLACDVLMHVRASRSISGDQVAQLEKLVFAGGPPSRDGFEILVLIDSYLRRREPCWAELMARAAAAFLPASNQLQPTTSLAKAA